MAGSGFCDLSLLRRLGGNVYSRPPNIPRDPEKQVAWLRQVRLFLINEDLEYTLTVDATTGPVCVIGTSRCVLLQKYSLNIIEDHTGILADF